MNENKTTVNGGIGFTGLLTIVFIVLKLTHVIDWKWVWVLSPVWITAAVVVAILLIIGFVFLIRVLFDIAKHSKYEKKKTETWERLTKDIDY